MGWTGVITNAGTALFAGFVQGDIINIDHIESGTGVAVNEAAMKARTSLVSPNSPETDGVVTSVTNVTGGVQVRMRIGANSASYTMKEIGLFVNTGEGTTPVLVAYFNNSDGVAVPQTSSFPDFAYILTGVLAMSNEVTFNLSVPTTALVDQATLDAAIATLNSAIAGKVAIAQGSANAGKFLVVGDNGNVVAAILEMTGAAAGAAGKAGLVPAPAAGKQSKFLRGDGTWQDPTDTKYSGSDGIQLVGNDFRLAASGATAGSYGPSADVAGNNDVQVKIPYLTIDAKGRITGISEKILTCKNTQYTNGNGINLANGAFSLQDSGATAGSYGPTGDVTGNEGNTIKIPQITIDRYGRVTGIVERTLTNKNSTGYLPTSGGTVSGVTTFSNTTESSGTGSGAVKISGGLGVAKNIYAAKVYNAVWNDYAECRRTEDVEPGYCVRSCPDGIMRKTDDFRLPGCRIVSDTFGSCMGETAEAKTPVAVAGRVLAYPYTSREDFQVGDPVCSAPNGKVAVMSRDEVMRYPDRIIGVVAEIPDYNHWIAGTEKNPVDIPVNGRIWIDVR